MNSVVDEKQSASHAAQQLNPFERDIWFESQKAPHSHQFTVALRICLPGSVDVERLRLVAENVLRSEPACFKTYHDNDGHPAVRQASCKITAELFEFTDESGSSAFYEEWSRHSWNFACAPLIETAIGRMGTSVMLMIRAHHIVADSWALDVLSRKILNVFEGKEAFPQSIIQEYVENYAAKTPSLHGAALDHAIREVAGTFNDLNPVLSTKSGTKLSSSQRYRRTFTISAEDVQRALDIGMTPFMTVSAPLAVLLSCQYGSEHFLIGVPFLNRGEADITAVTQRANTLPVSVQLSHAHTLREVAVSIKRQVNFIKERESVPLGQLVSEIARSGHNRQLFDATVSYLRYPQTAEGVPSSTHRSIAHVHAQDAVAIHLHTYGENADVCGEICLNSAAFDSECHASVFLDAFLQLVDGFLTQLDKPLNQVSLLTYEQAETLRTFEEGPTKPYSEKDTVISLFRAQAARTPYNIALRDHDHATFTYAELDNWSSAIATELEEHGVGPGDVVAVSMVRSPQLMAAIFAVLKTGAAYLPIDSEYPADRIRYMLEDSNAKRVITNLPLVMSSDDPRRFDLDALPLELAREEVNYVSKARPQDPAYIIYTSGSTGRPKGVVIEHHSVINRLEWMQEIHPLSSNDVILQKTPISFDVSVWELFWWSLTGASVALLEQGAQRDPRALIKAISDHNVTVAHFVPSMFEPYIQALADDREQLLGVQSLRCLFTSGEALSSAVVNKFRKLFTGETQPPRLINLYGPTEATVDVTWYELDLLGNTDIDQVPIGFPINNTSIRIVSQHGVRQLVNVPGELQIGGVQLARGYLNRPELTAERFITDPEDGRRWYRTGDLAAWANDGSILYLGRMDGQVKIRGNRIELGEIKNTLLNLPNILNAEVVVEQDEKRGNHLVALFVSRIPQTERSLREQMANALPAFMLPSRFVALEHIPLTPNGKFDRGQALAMANTSQTTASKAELSVTERLVTDIWGDILGQQDIIAEDDFYSIGGDSILMLKVRSELEKHGYDANLSDLSDHTTVRELGRFLELTAANVTQPKAALSAFELVTDNERKRLAELAVDAYPISQLQLGLLFHSREQEQSRVYKDVFRYTLKMDWSEQKFREALRDLIQRHPALRTTFNIGEYSTPLQLIHKDLSVDDVLAVTTPRAHVYEQEIAKHMRAWSAHNYSFATGPLFNVAVFINESGAPLDLVLSFHHAILDGGSVANLIRELLLCYARGNDEGLGYPTRDLPNPSLFVQDELAAMQSREHRAYWKGHLDGATSTLPIGLAGHLERADSGMFSYRFFVEPALDDALVQLAKRSHLPIKTFYLAAHCSAIAAMSNARDVVTGVVTHARPEIRHAEHILGMFLNTLPLRVNLAEVSAQQLVESIFRHEKASHRHRRFPLSEIQKDNAGVSIRTAFNYIHFHVLEEVAAQTGIEIAAFDPQEETSFALLVNVMRDFSGAEVAVRVDMDGAIYAHEQGEVFARLFNDALKRLAYQPHTEAIFRSPIAQSGYLASGPAREAFIPVPAQILQAVSHKGHAVAVTYEDAQWTYAQLWDAAGRIASLLSSKGVQQQDVVGLALPRSFEQIATALATLRSGAICLPIDVSYPVARIELILKIAAPKVVVTRSSVNELPDCAMRLNLTNDLMQTVEAGCPDVAIESTDDAYILFTSGSTGTPKGVAMPHRGLANLVGWQNKSGSGAVGSTLQYAPLSFDVSFQEIFSTLCAGSTLHLIGEEERRDPSALLRFMDRKCVERVFMPYIALQQLAEAAVALDLFPGSLRVVGSSGEQLRVTQEIRVLMRNLRGGILENQYGPTETHVVTSYSMSGNPNYFPALPPIGTEIDGVGILILDDAANVIPDGVPGEICVYGDALASGYYKAPEETDKKFIRHDHVPGKVFYRTGDIGIKCANGSVISLGRNDNQVKVRGYRIELSEIELKVLSFFEARNEHIDVAVIAKPRDEHDAYLVAYLAGSGSQDDAVLSLLRHYLSEELPTYMVPTHMAWIAQMPTTPSGKRDDATLRKLNIQLSNAVNYREPSGEYEVKLCQLAAELLKTPKIYPQQSIFDCGATSLTAMRLVVLVEKLYGTNVPLSSFVSAPTMEKLSVLIQKGGGAFTFDPLVPLRETGERTPLFLVHPMGGNILSYLRMLPHLPAEQPLYALQASGVDAGSEPIPSVEEQASLYIKAMRRIQPKGPYVIGGWSYGGFIAFEIAQQLIRTGERVANVLILDTMALSSHAQGKASDDALLSWFFWELLWTSRGSELPVQIVPDHIATLQERFDFITDHAISIGAIPAGSTKAVMQRLFEVYRTNWEAATQYNYEAKCPELDITLIRAIEPLPPILRDMHDTIRSEYNDPLNGWAAKTSGMIKLIEVDGDHLTIMEEPFVGALVTAILEEIK